MFNLLLALGIFHEGNYFHTKMAKQPDHKALIAIDGCE